MKKTLWISSSIFVLFMIWVITYQSIDHQLIMPSPQSVFLSMFELLTNISTLGIIASSIFRLFISILLSTILGIILGMLSGLNQKVSWVMKPYVTILRTIPVISIIVILLILFGYRITPFIITFLMVFPIVFQAAESGIKAIDRELIDVYHLERHNFIISIQDLYFPMIQKYLILSFLQSFGLGLKVLIMAEYLGQTRNSIGNSLYLAKSNLNYSEVFAWTILLILVSFSLEYIVHSYQTRKLME
jgi:NitT/TauT family transport system permease protein